MTRLNFKMCFQPKHLQNAVAPPQCSLETRWFCVGSSLNAQNIRPLKVLVWTFQHQLHPVNLEFYNNCTGKTTSNQLLVLAVCPVCNRCETAEKSKQWKTKDRLLMILAPPAKGMQVLLGPSSCPWR